MAYSNYGGNNSYGGGSNHGNQGSAYGQQGGYGGNYPTTSYGAPGGADGGGFMSGSQGGGSQGEGKKTYGADSIRPITIMQANEAYQPHPQAEFKIDDVEVTQVTLVGQIRNIAQQTTNMTYKLDDGTGTIEVKQWIDSMDVDQAPRLDADGNEIPDPKHAFKAGDWCRVWGRIKAFNNRRHVGAHALRPVPDKNEISYHLLEATYVHLYLTRGPPEGLAAAAGAATGDGYQAGAPAQPGAYDHSSRQMAGLSVVARKVLQAIRDTPQNNEGLHVQNIAAVMGMPMADVMKGGDELLQQNIIFPTVDDHTWALIE